MSSILELCVPNEKKDILEKLKSEALLSKEISSQLFGEVAVITVMLAVGFALHAIAH